MNLPQVDRYIDYMLAGCFAPVQILETLDWRQRATDAIIMGLRLTEGLSREDFLSRFDVDIFLDYQEVIRSCLAKGLIEQKSDRIYLTPRAFFLSNQVLNQFID